MKKMNHLTKYQSTKEKSKERNPLRIICNRKGRLINGFLPGKVQRDKVVK